MIVVSLALILVAVVLLVFGLAGGSSPLLVVSIGASLLAAVALVAGARQAAAGRASAAHPTGPEPDIPAQHLPPTMGTGDPGWRQPPGPPVAEPSAPFAGADVPAGGGYDDEPAAQEVTPEEIAQLALLPDEVHVVDGRPRYHLAACPRLVGQEPEALSVAEAVELDFTPCAHCTPATTLLSRSGRL